MIKLLTSAAPLTKFSKKEPRSSTLSSVKASLTRVSFERLFGSRSNSAFCLEERESSTVTYEKDRKKQKTIT